MLRWATVRRPLAHSWSGVQFRRPTRTPPADSPHHSIHGSGRRGVGDGSHVPFVLSSVNFFGRVYFLWGQAGRRAKGSLQRAATARTADRKTGQNVRRHDLHRSNASMIKQKKNQQTRAKDVGGRASLYRGRRGASSPRTEARKMMFFVLEEKVRRLEKPHRPMSCILSVCSALATLLCLLLTPGEKGKREKRGGKAPL